MKENYKKVFLEDLPNKPEEIETEIEANIFIDSSLASLLHNYKSVTVCVIMIGDMIYKLASNRQKAVATSTFSAEFVAYLVLNSRRLTFTLIVSLSSKAQLNQKMI